MEIKALSSSLIIEAIQYSRTRLLRWRLAALWMLLLAGLLATAAVLPSPATLATHAALLALAVALLRLWDDLADLSHDRRTHPERVLVAAVDPRPFVALLAIGLLALALAFLDDARRLSIYCGLLAALALLYHGPLRSSFPRPVRAYLVLSKYPVLVFLAGAPPSGRAWLVALCLYAVLGVYEWRDDSELRGAPWPQLFLGSASGAALVSLLFLTGGEQP